MNRAGTLFMLVPALLFLCVATALAWDTVIQETPHGPSRFVVVDKGRQQLYLFQQHSPLKRTTDLTCSTGQIPGDKLSEGDLRTPEGVYFIDRRLTSGLDYDLYGTLAYTLNFPNPVDIIKGKTGSGIWIHGRGHSIQPMETKGCIALNDADIGTIDQELEADLPTIIAQGVQWTEGAASDDDETSRLLVAEVESWAKSWESKSDEFFTFYQPRLFALSSGEPFQAFTRQKRGLFEHLPWIQVMVDDVHVIAGPDYWVTYFGQFYRSPFLVSEGIKRLYWQRDEQGRLRIVGREWDRRPLGLETRYLEKVGQEVSRTLEMWREAWQKAHLEDYAAFYDDKADQQGRGSLRAIAAQKKELWASAPPERVLIKDLTISMHPKGVQADFIQEYTSANGYSDTGRKTVVLSPFGEDWRIVSEEWRAL